MLNYKTGIADEEKVARIVRDLARNASDLRKAVNDDNLDESRKFAGIRVSLIEELRDLKEAKVSIASSDIKGDMNLLVSDIENNVSEAMKTIREKSMKLLKGLADMRSAKKIAVYKVQVPGGKVLRGQGAHDGY